MNFDIDIKYSECDIIRNGETVGSVKFNAHDVHKRSAFFNLYNQITAIDNNIYPIEMGSDNVIQALEQATNDAISLYAALEKGIDDIFGRQTAALLTYDNKDPAVLLEFLVFAANEFRVAAGLKIDKYINSFESDVMD